MIKKWKDEKGEHEETVFEDTVKVEHENLEETQDKEQDKADKKTIKDSELSKDIQDMLIRRLGL